MLSLKFKLLLPLLLNLSPLIYIFVSLVIIRIGFIGCLIGPSSNSSGDRYVSALIGIISIVATPVFTLIEG